MQDNATRAPLGTRLMGLGLLIAVVALASWAFRSNEEAVNAGPYQAGLAVAAVAFIAGAILRSRS